MKKGETTALRDSLSVGKERKKKESGDGSATGKRADKFVSGDQTSRWPQTVGVGQTIPLARAGVFPQAPRHSGLFGQVLLAAEQGPALLS